MRPKFTLCGWISRERSKIRTCGFRGLFDIDQFYILERFEQIPSSRFREKVENRHFDHIFSPNSGFVTFHPLSMSNSMQNIKKIGWPVIENKSRQTNRGQSIGPTSKVGGSKTRQTKVFQTFFFLLSISKIVQSFMKIDRAVSEEN